MPSSLEHRRAVHEGGHVVAALRLGIPISSVTIAAGKPHVHRAEYRPRHGRGAEFLATFCLAGGIAEKLLCGPGDCGDAIDRRMARECLGRQYGGREIDRRLEHARRAAHALMVRYLEDVEIVALALLCFGTLDAEWLRRVLSA
jgi:hypothetical protein